MKKSFVLQNSSSKVFVLTQTIFFQNLE